MAKWTIYGLKNCDTCRKARKWLDNEAVAYEFRDLRADGFAATDLARWTAAVGWETLLNRRGTTWRGLPDADKEGLDAAKAASLMRASPALIKRPVFDGGAQVLVGFDNASRMVLATK